MTRALRSCPTLSARVSEYSARSKSAKPQARDSARGAEVRPGIAMAARPTQAGGTPGLRCQSTAPAPADGWRPRSCVPPSKKTSNGAKVRQARGAKPRGTARVSPAIMRVLDTRRALCNEHEPQRELCHSQLASSSATARGEGHQFADTGIQRAGVAVAHRVAKTRPGRTVAAAQAAGTSGLV